MEFEHATEIESLYKYSLNFYVSQIPKKTNKNVSIEINNRVSGPRKTVPINVAKR